MAGLLTQNDRGNRHVEDRGERGEDLGRDSASAIKKMAQLAIRYFEAFGNLALSVLESANL
jgi:hypothetical protein